MNQQSGIATIGERTPLNEIEAAFRKHWRDAVEKESDQAVMKASTLNLLVFVKDAEKYRQTLDLVHKVIAHHPGRVIIAHIQPDDSDEIKAYISAYSQKSNEGRIQIVAELISLKTGESGAGHLAGAILPLLLPDLPVYFWCTELDGLVNPGFKTLFHYTDRLIVNTPEEYESPDEFRNIVDSILALQQECKISDLSWAGITDWREAVAQFFDAEQNRSYLGMLQEIEIIYSGEKISNQAFLMAGWLSATLKNIPRSGRIDDESIIFYKSKNDQASIKIVKKYIKGISGLYKIKMIAQDEQKSIIFTAKAQAGGFIKTSVQIGGRLFPANVIPHKRPDNTQLLCDELDFLQQDEIYLQAFNTISEYLHES